MTPESRRAFLKRLRCFWTPMLLSGGGLYGYGSVLERHRLTVEQHDLGLALGDKGPRKLRAVALSDFHFDPLYETDYLEECVRCANELKPDVVLLTGDYVTHTSGRIDDFASVLGKLRTKCGLFACLGNHDHGHDPRRVELALKKQGIEMLVNQHTRVSCADGELVIAGLESAWVGQPSWSTTAHGMKAGDRPFVLVHEPDFAGSLCQDARIALQFSGHTHGGQIRVPALGALKLPTMGKNYQAGFYDVGRMKLHVNRGIGTIGVHLRFLCPPEIACFDITNTDTLA